MNIIKCFQQWGSDSDAAAEYNILLKEAELQGKGGQLAFKMEAG